MTPCESVDNMGSYSMTACGLNERYCEPEDDYLVPVYACQMQL